MNRRYKTYKTAILLTSILIGLSLLVQIQNRIDVIEVSPDRELELLWVPDIRVVHGLALGDDNTAADMLWLRSIFYIAEQHPELAHHHGEECPICHDHFHKGEAHSHDFDHEHHHRVEETATPTDSEVSDEELPDNYDPLDFRHNRSLKNLLQYDVDSGKALHLYRLLNTVTDLDPMFAMPYFEGAMNLGLFEGRYNEAIKLIDKGVEALPDRWEMHYYRGFLRLFYMNDKAGAMSDIQTAALKPDAPIIVVQLAAALQVGLGHVDMALEFLQSIYEITDDPAMRDKIRNMLEVYGKLVGKDIRAGF